MTLHIFHMGISKKNRLGSNLITQIGIVVNDIHKTVHEYALFFDVSPPKVTETNSVDQAHTVFRGKPSDARAKLAFFEFKNITIELIEPIGGPSTWQEFLDSKGEGVHHIAFQVKNSEKITLDLAHRGIDLVQKGDYRGGCYKYFDASSSLKIILELLETKLR
jgi:hypothetical protein